MQPGLERGDQSEVLIQHDEHRDETVRVYDSVVVEQEHHVNSVNGYESFSSVTISYGMAEKPEAVTKRVAKMVYDEFGYEVEDDGIRVVDMSADNTEVI